MARNRNAPAGQAGASIRDHQSPGVHSLAAFQAQLLASRFALPVELVATVAALALGGGNG